MQVLGETHRALRAPKRVILPRRTTDIALAVVVVIAGGPLRLEIPLAGMAHQGAIAGRRDRQPVGEMPAVARAPSNLTRRVDEVKALDRGIGGFVEIVGRPLQRVELNIL